jgi:hypothetical protein
MVDDKALEEVTNFLLDLQDLTELEAEETIPKPGSPQLTITPPSFQSEVQQWHRHLVQGQRGLPVGRDGRAGRACSLGAALHLLATSAVKPSRARLQAHSNELFRVLVTLPEGEWSGAEDVYTRL